MQKSVFGNKIFLECATMIQLALLIYILIALFRDTSLKWRPKFKMETQVQNGNPNKCKMGTCDQKVFMGTGGPTWEQCMLYTEKPSQEQKKYKYCVYITLLVVTSAAQSSPCRDETFFQKLSFQRLLAAILELLSSFNTFCIT